MAQIHGIVRTTDDGIQIKITPNFGGVCGNEPAYYAFFSYEGYNFYASLTPLVENNEFMVFNATKNNRVTRWHEIYCKRNIPLSPESLEECIKGFKQDFYK